MVHVTTSRGHEEYVSAPRTGIEIRHDSQWLMLPLPRTVFPGPRFKWTHAGGHMPPHHFTMWFMPLTLPLDPAFSHPRIGIESGSFACQGSVRLT